MNSTLREICTHQARHIGGLDGLKHDEQPVDGGRLLYTIAGLESTFGQRREFVRFEPGYGPGGYYYRNAEHVRELWHRYGVLAASSFGSFQVMFITAYELGFKGHPIDLQQDMLSAYWAARLIGDRFIARQKASSLREIFDAYNSGNWRDGVIPVNYVTKGVKLYGEQS